MAETLPVTLLGIEPVALERHLLARFLEIIKIDRENGWHWSDIDFNHVFHASKIRHQQCPRTLTTDDEYRWFWSGVFLPEKNQSVVIMIPWVTHREGASQADRNPCVFAFGDIRLFIVHRTVERFVEMLETHKETKLSLRAEPGKFFATTS